MQLFPILVVAVVLAADGGLAASPEYGPGGLTPPAAAIGPVLALIFAAWLVVNWCGRTMTAKRSPRPVAATDRFMQLARWLLLVNHAVAVLLCDWLTAVRTVLGDPVLVDELVAMLPPLLGATALWWVHYPIERRLREAVLIRRLDMGKPIHAIPGRLRFVIQQTRLNLLLLLLPVLMILTLAEASHVVLDRSAGDNSVSGFADVVTFGLGLCVFIFSPWLARVVLSIRPLDAGPVREELKAICRRHRVRVRQIFLWNTDGLMINAAVMGLIGRLRYILLTDALLENLSVDQVRAVMAHEIGHIRRHHMFWLVLSLLAMLILAGFIVSLLFLICEQLGVRFDESKLIWIDGAATVIIAVIALITFGWISRRYERQADTFAVQHLSAAQAEAEGEPGGRIGPDAIVAMHSALHAIARLNTVDPRKRSWRHGSIAWRQAYLASIVGRPSDSLPIDRLVRGLKIAAALIVLMGGTATALIEWHAADRARDESTSLVLLDAPVSAAQDPSTGVDAQ